MKMGLIGLGHMGAAMAANTPKRLASLRQLPAKKR